MTQLELVRALQAHHNIVTNGPFINMTIDDQPVGASLSASGSTVTAELTVDTAPWVGADRWRIRANGEVVASGAIELDERGRWTHSVELDVPRDTWFLFEVEGDNNLFPVAPPIEDPPFDLQDAVGNLAGPIGFGGSQALRPPQTYPITPFAFTNPIWVDAGQDGEFTPVGPSSATCSGSVFQPGGLLRAGELDRLRDRLRAVQLPDRSVEHPMIFGRSKGEMRDVRLIFESWGSHSH
jgi:hypothetical protein